MNRRAFFSRTASSPTRFAPSPTPSSYRIASASSGSGPLPSAKISSADLSPYQPRPDKPWDARRAGHLLRRTGFGITQSQLGAALASTPSALVDAMLAPTELPENPFFWATQPPYGPDVDKETRAMAYGPWTRLVQMWWLRMMAEQPTMLREKMVLFWHNHFVSEVNKVEVPHYMFYQNQLFRKYAFGDFRELTKAITVDPAMLIYLDGATNKAGNPNENYARELMELFTLGVGTYGDGTPHYTEGDIIEMARALTGWDVQDLLSVFHPEQFDGGMKTIFGQSAAFGVSQDSPRNVLDLIFQQEDRDYNRKRAAIFLCTKLYHSFVFEVPDMEIVSGMAKTLEENGWRIDAVLRELLSSEHFFDDNLIGAQIKSPIEFVVGSIREFALEINENPDPGDPEVHDPLSAATYLSQPILSPPNVKGWPGGRAWITVASLPTRARYTKLWVEPIAGALHYDFKPIDYVKSLPNPDDVHDVLDHLLTLLLTIDVSQTTKNNLLDILLGGGKDYEWKADNSEQRIRSCLVKIGALGEYQLM
jgi:uncharacterized protein (DUF1800 family)